MLQLSLDTVFWVDMLRLRLPDKPRTSLDVCMHVGAETARDRCIARADPV